MTNKGKIFGTLLVTGAILMSFTGRVESQAPRGSFGGELRGIMQFTGQVVCAGCSLQEVQKTQPQLTNLYQLSHVNPEQGQVVMWVETFSDPHERMRWESIVGPSHQLQIRVTDQVFQELTAEENLFRKLTVTGLLRSTRVLSQS